MVEHEVSNAVDEMDARHQAVEGARHDGGDEASAALLPVSAPKSDGKISVASTGLLKKWGRRASMSTKERMLSEMPKWRSTLYRFVDNSRFNHASTVLVLGNVVLMCMPYAGMSTGYALAVEVASDSVTCLFAVEMAMKVLAFGWTAYWADFWNRVD
eukprot:7384251-Prymnesium_polylepis.1